MESISSKKKLVDFAKVASSSVKENESLIEKMRFYKKYSKKFIELIKKYRNISSDEEQKKLEEELGNLKSQIQVITAQKETEISKVRETFKEIEGKYNNKYHAVKTQEENQKFLLQNILKEKSAMLEQSQMFFKLLKKYKFFMESKRDINLIDPLDISQYNTLFLSIGSTTLKSEPEKKKSKSKKARIYDANEILTNLMSNLSALKKKIQTDQEKKGFIINTYNNKFKKQIIINFNDFMSEDSECSSRSENEFSLSEITSSEDDNCEIGGYEEKIKDNVIAVSHKDSRKDGDEYALNFNSSEDNDFNSSGDEGDGEIIIKAEDKSAEELRQIKEQSAIINNENQKLKKKIQKYKKMEKKMILHIKKLKERFRLSQNNCLNFQMLNSFKEKNKINISVSNSASKLPYINPVKNV